jgi:LemA protein
VGGGFIGLLIIALVIVYISIINRAHSEPLVGQTSSQMMSERAMQIEARILRGDALNQSDISGLSAYELRVLRNVHFARYGRKFDRPGLGDYFHTRPWYQPSDNYNDNALNAQDKDNINLIVDAENALKSEPGSPQLGQSNSADGASSRNAQLDSLVTKQNTVRVMWSNVETQLRRRADLIPNLVNTVKGYVKQEEPVFGELAAARSRLLNAQNPNESVEADNQLTEALVQLFVITEDYPNLKADSQFNRLMDELSGTENRISVARRDYNQVARDYNALLQQMANEPGVNLAGFEKAVEFGTNPVSKGAPKVRFLSNYRRTCSWT